MSVNDAVSSYSGDDSLQLIDDYLSAALHYFTRGTVAPSQGRAAAAPPTVADVCATLESLLQLIDAYSQYHADRVATTIAATLNGSLFSLLALYVTQPLLYVSEVHSAGASLQQTFATVRLAALRTLGGLCSRTQHCNSPNLTQRLMQCWFQGGLHAGVEFSPQARPG